MSERVPHVTAYNAARKAQHAGRACAYCGTKLAATNASGVAYVCRGAVFALCKTDWERLRWGFHRALEAAEAASETALRDVSGRALEHLKLLDRGEAA